MVKKHTHIDPALSGQGSLFDTGMAEGALNISLGFRQTLSRSMHGCGKDRYQIAAEASRLMGRDLSKDVLDKCCGSDLTHALRAESLTAVCHVTGSLEPFAYLLQPLGADVLTHEDHDLLELARLLEDEKKIQARIMVIRAQRGLK